MSLGQPRRVPPAALGLAVNGGGPGQRQGARERDCAKGNGCAHVRAWLSVETCSERRWKAAAYAWVVASRAPIASSPPALDPSGPTNSAADRRRFSPLGRLRLPCLPAPMPIYQPAIP